MVSNYRFKGFLFDLDGTLLDTAPDLLAALNQVLLKNKKPILELNDVRSIISEGSEGLIKRGFGLQEYSSDFDLAKQEFLDYYHDNLTKRTTLFEGIEEIIEEIESSGRSWGIVTNKPSRFTIPLVNYFGWSRRAACIICGDSLERSKPFPEPLIEGAARLNLPLKDCLYVGDALTDITAAKAAKMRVVTASYGYVPNENWNNLWGADGVAETPRDLRNWLG